MAKKMMPFGGKMAKPFGNKESAKEEKLEKKVSKKAYMAGEKKEKTMKAYGGGMMGNPGGMRAQQKQAMPPARPVKPAKGRV